MIYLGHQHGNGVYGVFVRFGGDGNEQKAFCTGMKNLGYGTATALGDIWEVGYKENDCALALVYGIQGKGRKPIFLLGHRAFSFMNLYFSSFNGHLMYQAWFYGMFGQGAGEKRLSLGHLALPFMILYFHHFMRFHEHLMCQAWSQHIFGQREGKAWNGDFCSNYLVFSFLTLYIASCHPSFHVPF
jgi:hypothetical protein